MRLLSLFAIAFFAFACHSQEPRTAHSYATDAKKAYEHAYAEFEARNWVESQALFQELKRKYAYSRYAQLAELRIADADFEQGKFAEALRAYRQFAHEHRSDEANVLYARSRMTEAQVNQIVDSVLLPASEERDQAPVADAYKELRGFLNDYPDTVESESARERLRSIVGRLVRHELYAARFYLSRDKFDATVERIDGVIRMYVDDEAVGPMVDPELEIDALLMLGETYLKMQRSKEAMAAFERILARHPNAPRSVQAKSFLAMISKRRP